MGDTPIAGLFIMEILSKMEHPQVKWMINGVPPFMGTPK
jgi:hypothetical protein